MYWDKGKQAVKKDLRNRKKVKEWALPSFMALVLPATCFSPAQCWYVVKSFTDDSHENGVLSQAKFPTHILDNGRTKPNTFAEFARQFIKFTFQQQIVNSFFTMPLKDIDNDIAYIFILYFSQKLISCISTNVNISQLPRLWLCLNVPFTMILLKPSAIWLSLTIHYKWTLLPRALFSGSPLLPPFLTHFEQLQILPLSSWEPNIIKAFLKFISAQQQTLNCNNLHNRL